MRKNLQQRQLSPERDLLCVSLLKILRFAWAIEYGYQRTRNWEYQQVHYTQGANEIGLSLNKVWVGRFLIFKRGKDKKTLAEQQTKQQLVCQMF